jgi:lipoyl(octanoyl) transferase
VRIAGTSATWRVLETPPAPGQWNMALDDTLVESVRAGDAPILRFYRWRPACVSLGRNQPTSDAWNPSRLARLGVDLVRRPTGGRAVLHDDELTYSVVAPVGVLGTPRSVYRLVNEILVDGLARLGAAAGIQASTGARAPLPSTTPCFAEPVEGEVLAGRRKLIGSAQVCRDGVLLQHGSLPLRASPALADPRLLESFRGGAPAYLGEILDPLPDWSEIVAALCRSWEAAVGRMETVDPHGRAARPDPRHLETHADPAWVLRR